MSSSGLLWPRCSERGGFGAELKCFRGCETDVGKMGSACQPWTHLSCLQGLAPCYRLRWATKLLTRERRASCRSVCHAAIQAEKPKAPSRNIGAVWSIQQPETSLCLPPHSMSHHSGVGFRPGLMSLFLCEQLPDFTVSLFASTLPSALLHVGATHIRH